MVCYAIVGVCCDIVKELVNSYGGVFSGMCLLGADGAKCGEEFVINCAGIIEERTDNALDAFDPFVVKGWACVSVRN